MLHAILLGIFKYIRNTFCSILGIKGKKSELAHHVDGLAQVHGKFLTHQSEKDFPKTHFNKGLYHGRMMATKYRGVLLVMAAILRSSGGGPERIEGKKGEV